MKTIKTAANKLTAYVPRCLNWVVLVAACLLTTACGTTYVQVDREFPDPVVTPLPYRVGVHFSTPFTTYAYNSETEKLSFELGSQQTKLFDQVFKAMFVQTQQVPDPAEGASYPDLDMIIVPVLEQYAFLSPEETATNFYTVSLKYHIRVYSPDGTIVGYWPFVAYGKNRGGTLDRGEPLGDATSTALRDAAAALVAQFSQAIEKQDWEELNEPG